MSTIENKPYRVGICGSYGGMNLGDESILTAIVHELRRRVPVTLMVFSRNAAHTLAHHQVEEAADVRALSRAQLRERMRALDLLILGGGGILFDGEASEFVRPILLAHEIGVPVAAWAIGVGPLQHPAEQANVHRALDNARSIMVRDLTSRLILEQIGVTREILITADPAHLLQPEPFTDAMLANEAIDPGACLVGVSVRGSGLAAPDLDGRSHERITSAVDYLAERFDTTAVFIPMEQGDLRHSHAIASGLTRPCHARFVTSAYSACQIRGLVERLSFAIGMRLHFLLFSASAGVPSTALRYGAKIGDLADELGFPAPAIQDTTPGQFIAAIDRAWHQRDALGRQLRERSAELGRRAARTADHVAKLLRDQDRAPDHDSDTEGTHGS